MTKPRSGPILCVVLALAPIARAHDVPSQLPEPLSTPEAWNVLDGASANIDALIDANLLRDATFQIANMDVSLRYLSAHAADSTDAKGVRELTDQLLAEGSKMVNILRDRAVMMEQIRAAWLAYRKLLADLAVPYPLAVRHAPVFICPMHPLDRHLKSDELCNICGMPLMRRHLPASAVYEKPGQPTMRMTFTCDTLMPGREANVRMRLIRNDGKPVTLRDLVEAHTKKIHLLINDRSLSDYHHEHPTPTDQPGEYAFRFTPTKPGPYRVWADVVPADSDVQEYVVNDLPAGTSPELLQDREPTWAATFGGRRYDLNISSRVGVIRVGQTLLGTISVSESDGRPCTALEPIMGTFAHIVGFNEDLQTVLHIHPYAKPPTSDADRSGPAFAFKFYAPKPGFYRLYGQVQIDGRSQFPAFGVTVLPALPTSRP